MSRRAVCPACGESVAAEVVTLWDGRTYCRGCVEAVSPELYQFAIEGGQLVDVVQISDVRAWNFILGMGKPYLLVIFLISFLVYLLHAFQGEFGVRGVILAFFILGSGGIILISLQAFIRDLSKAAWLPRKIQVSQGELLVQNPGMEKRIPLEKCQWSVGNTLDDQVCLSTGLRNGILILTPLSRIACGHSPEMLLHWYYFLTLARLRRKKYPGYLQLFTIGCLGTAVGIFTGLCTGNIIALLTNQDQWISVISLLGALEGALIGLMYAVCTLDVPEYARKIFHPKMLVIPFWAIGSQVGIVDGLRGAIIGGTLNVCVGLIASWLCRRQIETSEKQTGETE